MYVLILKFNKYFLTPSLSNTNALFKFSLCYGRHCY